MAEPGGTPARQEEDLADIEQNRRMSVMMLTGLLLAAYGFVACASFVAYGELAIGLTATSGSVIILAVLWLARRTRRVSPSAHVVLSVLLAGTVISNYFTGGLALSNEVVFFIIPVIAIFLLGRGGIPWTAGVFLVMAVFQYLHFIRYPFPQVIPASHQLFDMTLTWGITFVVVVIVVLYYEAARRLAAGQLMRSKERVEAANRTKGRFLANVSHELRTPLNAIIGLGDVTLQTNLSADQRQNLELMKKSAHNLLHLVEDILDLSRVEAGKMIIHPVPFDLRMLAVEVVEGLRPQAEGKGLSLSLQVEPAFPAALVGDSLRLRQILVNLLDNAVKFSDTGTVSVFLRMSNNGGAGVLITVEDNGIGIPREEQQRIFDAFSQVDGSVVRGSGGSGLGLAICRQLCDLMGGSIRVQSEPGQGSRFEVRLPLPAAPAPASRCERRILAVEDDAVSRDLVATILRTNGFQADVVADGRSAVEAAASGKYTLVLMDLQMPGMDGCETTRRIRTAEGNGRRVPVLAMTAHVLSEERDRCFAAGMDDFIGKPVEVQALLQMVHRWMG